MGTDIHLYVERLKDEKWIEVAPPFTQSWNSQPTWSPPWHESHKNEPDPRDRNYELFAFLADVRNGTGFAGVPTGKQVQPQFAGRGMPKDSSYGEVVYDEEGNYVSGSGSLGYHDFTYATLQELVDAPWDIEFTSSGIVNAEEFRQWQDKGIPDSWCGGVWGQQVIIYDAEDFKKLLERNEDTNNDYARIEFKWKPLENCSFRLWVQSLAERFENLSEVRVLIGFDS